MHKAVTFRAQLKTAISDLLTDAAMQCAETEEALVALAVALADYREEGTPLYPRLVVCDDRTAVLPVLGGSTPIEIGSGPRGVETMMMCLKKCAPLAGGGWAIWIERAGGTFRYGIFREPLVPTAIDLRSTLMSLERDDARVVFVAQVAQSTVEMLTPGIDPILIHMSGVRDDEVVATDEEARVAGWFVEDIESEILRESCLSFASTAIHDLLREAHGSLIAVVTRGNELPAAVTTDSIVLAEPDDLAGIVDRHSKERSSDALDELLCHRNLLGGMLRSDGAVLIDTRGRILAFNCFVSTDTNGLSPRDLTGGARRRAFAMLCSLVDDAKLRGAFLRSSDGFSQTHGSDPHDW